MHNFLLSILAVFFGILFYFFSNSFGTNETAWEVAGMFMIAIPVTIIVCKLIFTPRQEGTVNDVIWHEDYSLKKF